MSEMARKSVVADIEVMTITRPQATKTIVMLHGFGAGYEDLAPLAPYLDPKGAWNWVFPNGILEVPLGPYMSGRAWFPIRMAEIEAAAMRGEVVDFADVKPDGMDLATTRLLALLEQLRVAPKDLVLGGFSQGAMMALQVAVNLVFSPRGLLLFSSTLTNRQEWLVGLKKLAKVPFFQSHGRVDSILGHQHAVRLHELLQESGLRGELLSFQGAHEIPLPVIQKAARFLETLS